MKLEQLIRNLKKVNCDIEKLYSLLPSNLITSINSIDVDSNGKLILTFTNNTGTNTVQSNSLQKFIIRYNVLNYTELLTKLPTANDYAYVREEQGTKWLPGSIGGNYYSSGLYMFNGTIWVKDTTNIENQLSILLNDISLLQANSHAYLNKLILDGLGEDIGGNITYNNEIINSIKILNSVPLTPYNGEQWILEIITIGEIQYNQLGIINTNYENTYELQIFINNTIKKSKLI